jgi:Zn-dependent membrane protease YugP
LAAFLLFGSFPQLMLIVIVAFTITTLFSFVTLPVEFDASRRALVWLDHSGVARGREYDGAKDALWWAAMTYVSAALSSLVMLLYLILRYSGGE